MALASRLALALCLLTLSACDSAEDRAETHFQRGLELAKSGDTPRALIELKTALALDGSHRDARAGFARLLRDIGRTSEARAQYRRLSERDPQDMEARLALVELAILAQDWDTAERHGRALTKNPDGAEIASLAISFREAVRAKNPSRIRALTKRAVRLSEAVPDNPILGRILIDGLLADGRVEDAIATAKAVAEAEPADPVIHQVLAELLLAEGNLDGLGNHMRRMASTFPENRAAFLNHIQLVRHLHGEGAALTEIEMRIDEYGPTPALTSLKAALLYDGDAWEKAISLLQPSERTDDLVTLARMFDHAGNLKAARRLIDKVLRGDPAHVEALKMRAGWHLAANEAERAKSSLQLALQQSPGDAEARALMAQLRTRPLLAKAAHFEAEGAVADAVAIYEALHKEDPANWLVANNLASMLATYRRDDTSLNRAHAIARRFRNTDYPAFQDTYGWILHRRGNSEQALTYLELAAASLTSDAVVQFHLGMAYLALGREAEALRQLQTTADLAAPNDPRPQIATALAILERFRSGTARDHGQVPGTLP